MNKLLSGFHAGVIATGPMSVSMIAMQELLKQAEKSPFPPATISYELIERMPAGQELPESLQSLAALSAHLAYGGCAGALYGQLLSENETLSPILKGALFGAGFWAANYFGVLPALGVRARGPNMTAKRNGMMLLSHLVWGATLGMTEAALRKNGLQMLAGENKAPEAE